ncbi:MAG TPA: NAD(P)/FAD-dependent oxidoreductase [Rhizomicrobium sp.]|jgi:phytoene dehydrogenase-like protein
MSDTFDVAVIGAGIDGLTAAAYLAKAGKRVVVLEAQAKVCGLCGSTELRDGFLVPRVAQTLYALDPQVLKDFPSVQRGLAFAARDLAQVGLGEDGRVVTLSRDTNETVRSIALHARADAQAWPSFRAGLFRLARAMRSSWWTGEAFDPDALSSSNRATFAELQTMSAAAWLDSRFESGLLKATLAFDAAAGSLLEPGSALPLLWRAAQEIDGVQGAVALPRGSAGALAPLLSSTAIQAGATVQTGARVARLLVDTGSVTGVELESGETLLCGAVLSSLSRRNTLLGLAPDAAPLALLRALQRIPVRTGTALVTLALSDAPNLARGEAPLASRYIVADRLETIIAADLAARAGRLPDEIPFEIVVPSQLDGSVAPPGSHVLTCLVRPVPVAPPEGWNVLKPKLTAKIIGTLDRLSPGLVPDIMAVDVITPEDIADEDGVQTPERMIGPWRARIDTPIAGLYLCGAGVEPVAAVSGRAGRIAAALVAGKP